jgi:ATP-binding cassette, subfamily B (MDR/TAP), member 1
MLSMEEKNDSVHDIGNVKKLGLGEADVALLDAQVELPQTDAGYKTIYRFANRLDVVVMVLSSISAAAAGTSLPLMTVRTSHPELLTTLNTPF